MFHSPIIAGEPHCAELASAAQATAERQRVVFDRLSPSEKTDVGVARRAGRAAVIPAAELVALRTGRGFAVARGTDRYDRPYSIQDSSLATEACIWLGSDDKEGGRAHLTQADAAALIPLLETFVATGSIATSLIAEGQG